MGPLYYTVKSFILLTDRLERSVPCFRAENRGLFGRTTEKIEVESASRENKNSKIWLTAKIASGYFTGWVHAVGWSGLP